jgi:hypothetical protein
MKTGNCFELGESRNNWGLYCSDANPDAPEEFQYLTCPNMKACEDKIIEPNYDDDNLFRQIDTRTYSMQKNEACGYIIRGPPQMKP